MSLSLRDSVGSDTSNGIQRILQNSVPAQQQGRAQMAVRVCEMSVARATAPNLTRFATCLWCRLPAEYVPQAPHATHGAAQLA